MATRKQSTPATKAGALVASGLAADAKEAAEQLADMGESDSALRAPRRTRTCKVTATTPATTPAPQKGAQAATKAAAKPTPKEPKKSLVELLVEHAPRAKNAGDLARLAGVADLKFRKYLAHHSEGKRVLSPWRQKLHTDDAGHYDWFAAVRERRELAKAQAQTPEQPVAQPTPKPAPKARTPRTRKAPTNGNGNAS